MNYLIVGLGNTGPEYELTRHNIGFLALDALATKCDKESKFVIDRYAYVNQVRYKGKNLTLIKPTTFMNLSGKAVNYWLKQAKVEVANMLIITDDIALPFGKLRMRPKGSAGGHNGLGNIQEMLTTDIYTRLRVGVGSEFAKGRQIDYVLGKFGSEEMKDLPLLLDRCADAALTFCSMEVDKAMNLVNK